MSQAADHATADRQTVREAYLAAKDRQGAGDLDEAKRRYGQILMKIPHHAESLTMLGSIAYQQGDDLQAAAYLDRAIEIYRAVLDQMPKLLAVRAPLVNLLLARGRQGEAEALMADLELGFNPVRSTPEAFDRRRRAGIERGLPAMLINTVPKSASESIWNKLAEGLGIAQGHLSLGLFPDCCVIPYRAAATAGGGLIAKEHLLPTAHNLAVLAAQGIDRVVCHQRDPRQATLSWAHFVRDDVSMRLMAPVWRKIVPPVSVPKDDLSQQIDWCIEHYLPLLTGFARDWARVSDEPAQPIKVLFLSFEAFRRDPGGYYGRVLEFYGIDTGLFAGEAEAEVVHLRKGQTDEWREVFTPAQQKKAWQAMPPELAERFGWRP